MKNSATYTLLVASILQGVALIWATSRINDLETLARAERKNVHELVLTLPVPAPMSPVTLTSEPAIGHKLTAPDGVNTREYIGNGVFSETLIHVPPEWRGPKEYHDLRFFDEVEHVPQ